MRRIKIIFYIRYITLPKIVEDANSFNNICNKMKNTINHIIKKLSNIGYSISYTEYNNLEYSERLFIVGLLDVNKSYGNYNNYLPCFLYAIERVDGVSIRSISSASEILGIAESENKFDELISIVIFNNCYELFELAPFRNRLKKL